MISTIWTIWTKFRTGVRIAEFALRRETKANLRKNCETILALYKKNNGEITSELKAALTDLKSCKTEYRDSRRVLQISDCFPGSPTLITLPFTGARSALAAAKVKKLPTDAEIDRLIEGYCSKEEKEIIYQNSLYLSNPLSNLWRI